MQVQVCWPSTLGDLERSRANFPLVGFSGDALQQVNLSAAYPREILHVPMSSVSVKIVHALKYFIFF